MSIAADKTKNLKSEDEHTYHGWTHQQCPNESFKMPSFFSFALHPPKSELLNSWRVTGLIQDYFNWEDGIKKEKCEFFKQLLLKGFPQKLTDLLRNDF